jgi:mRNA interferase RelE/StbE
MFKLEFLSSAVKEFKRLDFVAQKMIKGKLEILAKNPEFLKNDIKALKGKLSGKFRLRVRDYRIIYQQKNDVLVILIVRIGHRKDVYERRS